MNGLKAVPFKEFVPLKQTIGNTCHGAKPAPLYQGRNAEPCMSENGRLVAKLDNPRQAFLVFSRFDCSGNGKRRASKSLRGAL